MKLEVNKDSLIIRLDGELDHHYAADIKTRIDAAVRSEGIRKIVFDFSRVGFMDSSGIGIIMGRYRLMEAVGGSVCAFGVSSRVKSLIDMSGLTRLITVCKSEQQALEVR